MLRPVKGGIFFSDSNKTYFAAGTDPRAMDLLIVADYPAIEGTDQPIDMVKFGIIQWLDLALSGLRSKVFAWECPQARL